MRLSIAVLTLLCLSATAISGQERGWTDGGPWVDMDSGQMVEANRLHTPHPDFADAEAIAVNATCSESVDRQQVFCYFISLSVGSSPKSKDCNADVTIERRTLRMTQRSRSHAVWSGIRDGVTAQLYTSLAVTFNPKYGHIEGVPGPLDKWEYREVTLYRDQPMPAKPSVSFKTLNSTTEASNLPDKATWTPFAAPCRPTDVRIRPVKGMRMMAD